MNPETSEPSDYHLTQLTYDEKCCYAKKWHCVDKKTKIGRGKTTSSTIDITQKMAMLSISDDMVGCHIELTADDARAIIEVLSTWLDWNEEPLGYDNIEEVEE